MRGWASYYRASSVANRREAQQAFECALEIDPSSADARIGIATSLVSNVMDGWSASLEQDQARAEQLLHEALQQGANRSMTHYAMGALRRTQMRLAEAQIELEAAIALDPNNARALYHLGQTMLFMGRPETAIPYIQKAIRLNPHDPNLAGPYWGLGTSYFFLGDVDRATDYLRKGRAANPRLFFIHLFLAGVLGFRGDFDEAKAALEESIKLMPEIASMTRWHAYVPAIKNPEYWTLLENTVNVGLRRIGFPDE